MMRLLRTPALNSLDELASLAYEIEGPRKEIALVRAVAALKRANPALKAHVNGIPPGLRVFVPDDPGLRPSDRTEPAASAPAERIDKLVQVIEDYAASFEESSGRRRADNVKRLNLVRSEAFSTIIRESVREPGRLLDRLAQRTQADEEKADERNRQIQEALNRAKEDLLEMRNRFS